MILPDQNELLMLLETYTERLGEGFAQRVRQKEQQLRHMETLLSQSSPFRKLEEVENTFDRLSSEYERTIQYLLIQKGYLPSRLKDQFKEAEHLCIYRKQVQLENIEKTIKMYDPRQQHKQGWARLFKGKHLVTLKELKVEDRFILEDALVIMEAVCLSKKEI
jgi:exonuclease VII large subunit